MNSVVPHHFVSKQIIIDFREVALMCIDDAGFVKITFKGNGTPCQFGRGQMMECFEAYRTWVDRYDCEPESYEGRNTP